MAIKFTREANSTDLLIRFTPELICSASLDQFVEEMQKAVREFVQTDPEVRILINEMVRTAFGQVDLLKLVTETIKQSLPTLAEPTDPKESPNAV